MKKNIRYHIDHEGMILSILEGFVGENNGKTTETIETIGAMEVENTKMETIETIQPMETIEVMENTKMEETIENAGAMENTKMEEIIENTGAMENTKMQENTEEIEILQRLERTFPDSIKRLKEELWKEEHKTKWIPYFHHESYSTEDSSSIYDPETHTFSCQVSLAGFINSTDETDKYVYMYPFAKERVPFSIRHPQTIAFTCTYEDPNDGQMRTDIIRSVVLKMEEIYVCQFSSTDIAPLVLPLTMSYQGIL